MTSYTRVLSEFARTTRFEDLPPAAVAATKRLVLDTVACIVSGHDLPSSEIVRKVKAVQGGAPQATVLVTGERLPAPSAAYVNSHLANAIDAEDTLTYTAHIAACTVPPALAIGELTGKSGAEVLAAIAVGYDVAGRIGLSQQGLRIDETGELKFAPVTGYSYAAFAATVAAGRLLDLDADQMLNAFGITAATLPLPSATTFGLALPRPMTKYAMYGTLGEVGVTAALLAKEGFTGELSALDGDKGLWRTMGALGCNTEAFTERLGQRWRVEEVAYKAYPACRFIAPVIEMFREIVAANSLALDEITRVDATFHGAAIVKNMGSASVGSMVDACFSTPYLLAASVIADRPGPAWHTATMRADPRIAAFAPKVHVTPEPSASVTAAQDMQARGHIARLPATIAVQARGQTFTARTEYTKGDPYDPAKAFGDAEIEQKFRDYCEDILGPANLQAAIDLCRRLDAEPTVDAFVRTLLRSAKSAAPNAARQVETA